MKKIYLLLMLLMVGIAAQAQRNIKLTMLIRTPAREANIKTGDVVSPVYVIKNLGTTAADSIAAGDTIWYQSPANTSAQLSGVILGKGIKIGDSAVLNVASLSSLSLPFASIKTLLSNTLAYETTFPTNTRHLWFLLMDTVTGKTGAPAIATVNKTLDTVGVWINKTKVGINEVSFEEPMIKTYPNPAVNQLSFEYDFAQNEKATATIIDVAGRTILVKELESSTSGKQDLDITQVPSGTYFLHLLVGDKKTVSKFSVVK